MKEARFGPDDVWAMLSSVTGAADARLIRSLHVRPGRPSDLPWVRLDRPLKASQTDARRSV
jgi:hypothetical protein